MITRKLKDGSIKIYTPCKINFRLKVLRKREDGYHDLSSIMIPVGLYDEITFVKTISGINIHCPDLSIEEKDNIVYKAVKAYAAINPIDFGININISKNIPYGAGLGGGSSDAAATLVAINSLSTHPISLKALLHLSKEIGADVPFFIKSVPCLAKGIGEILDPLKNWPKFWYVIVTPPVHVSTKWVYSNLNLKLTQPIDEGIIQYLRKGSLNIKSLLENDLERVTISMVPEIDIIKKHLIDLGAEGSLMTGSGSSVFGVFKEKDQAEKAYKAIASYKLGKTFLCEGL